jgi:hypothetical protein
MGEALEFWHRGLHLTDWRASTLARLHRTSAGRALAPRGAWEITKWNYPGGNQLDVPNQDELWAVLVARHLNGRTPSTVDIERAARRASGSTLAFGRKRRHLRRSRACLTLRPSTPNYGYWPGRDAELAS